jgi:ATP-dependent helicase/DNAse subunit B
LVVLTPEKVECRKSYPQHIPHWDGKVEDKTDWTPDGKEIAAVEANTQKFIHKVSSDIFTGLDIPNNQGGIGRDYESFSSLEMLIQNPFDYVLQYVFGCNETSRTTLSVVKGNVVHKMFNNVVLESGTDWNKLKTALVDNFDENFDKAVSEVGIELLSLNNRLTYNLFKNVIKTGSIPSFIKIIEDNKLTVVGSEVDFIVDFEQIGKFNAKIDMVLQNPEGKYVIMDFKWTDVKDKKKEEEIEKNMEMQLSLYAQAVRQHFGDGDDTCVEAIGYFMLRQGVFITEYQGLAKSKKVKVVKKKSTDSIFDMVKKSYEFRMNQLMGEDGESVIEEGEQMKVTDLGIEGYHDQGDRFPLKGIEAKAKGGYRGEKLTTYGKNVVLKGMLE